MNKCIFKQLIVDIGCVIQSAVNFKSRDLLGNYSDELVVKWVEILWMTSEDRNVF